MLSLKLISNPKSRRTTFLKRKKSLLKKAYELSTLCDVRTCIFIASSSSSALDPATDRAPEFETWPPNRSEIEGMIRAYKTHSYNNIKSFDLNHFFSERKAKIQTETCRLREKVQQMNPPNWDDCLSERELKGFVSALDAKIGVVEGMIEFMEADYDHLIDQSSTVDSLSSSPLETEESPQPQFDEFDLSDYLIGPNGVEYTYEDFQSLLEDDDLRSLLDNNNDAFDLQY